MDSEVTFDARNKRRDLDYLCSSAYFILLSLKGLFPQEKEKEEETKMTCRPACSYLAAGKNSGSPCTLSQSFRAAALIA